MTDSNQKKIILALLHDDIKITKLINGLDDLGMDAGEYSLSAGSIVLELIDFGLDKQSSKYDKLYEYYLELIDKAVYTDTSKIKRPLEKLSMQVYQGLLQHKNSIQKRHNK